MDSIQQRGRVARDPHVLHINPAVDALFRPIGILMTFAGIAAVLVMSWIERRVGPDDSEYRT